MHYEKNKFMSESDFLKLAKAKVLEQAKKDFGKDAYIIKEPKITSNMHWGIDTRIICSSRSADINQPLTKDNIQYIRAYGVGLLTTENKPRWIIDKLHTVGIEEEF